MAIGLGITSAGGGNYLRAAKSSFQTHEPFSLSANPNPPNNSVVRTNSFSANHNSTRFIQRISAINSADLPPKNNNNNPIIFSSSSSSSCDDDDKKQQPPTNTRRRDKWAVESWKTKKAYDQLPEYPDMEELESVLQTLDAFPPLVSAGEARDLEKLLGEAAMATPLCCKAEIVLRVSTTSRPIVLVILLGFYSGWPLTSCPADKCRSSRSSLCLTSFF